MKSLAALALGLVTLAACSSAVAGNGRAAKPSTRSASAAKPAIGRHHPSPTRPLVRTAPKLTQSVHAGLFEADGQTYGVGMPVIVRFTKPVTDHAAFEKAVSVKVNGHSVAGAWDWKRSRVPGWTTEAHYRTANFWPAHSSITVDAPLKGRSAGHRQAFDDSLTLTMHIGAAHISTVHFSDSSPRMTVTSDDRTVRTLDVSLGAPTTPTYRGIKVVEEFDRVEDMGGAQVAWSVRLTDTGEFVHAAPWNNEIGQANLSHGCTNLSTGDADWFYHFSQLGDVVLYPDAPGSVMRPDDGIGDWNVPWPQWRAGGGL